MNLRIFGATGMVGAGVPNAYMFRPGYIHPSKGLTSRINVAASGYSRRVLENPELNAQATTTRTEGRS